MSGAPLPTRRLSAAIWALGCVSLLMDISPELIHSMLPVLLVTSVGASRVTVGLLDGAAKATALPLTKAFAAPRGTPSSQLR